MPIQMNSSLARGPSGSESSCGLDGNSRVGLAPVLISIVALPYLGQTAASEQHAPTPTTARHPDRGQILHPDELAAPRDEQPQRSDQASRAAALRVLRESAAYKRASMRGPLAPASATSAHSCGDRWSRSRALRHTIGAGASLEGEPGRRSTKTKQKRSGGE